MAHNLLNADTIMIDTNKPELSDEVWINPRSKFYVEEVFEHEISVSLNGKEHFDVEEYYISEICDQSSCFRSGFITSKCILQNRLKVLC